MVARQQVIVHQFLSTARPRDAITNQAVLVREALAERGIRGEIFAAHRNPGAASLAHGFPSTKLWNCDLLLLHHGTGYPGLGRLLKIPVPKQLVYHNITPESFFPHDRMVARLCRLGRQQLVLLRDHVIGSFCDSRFNAGELLALGYGSSEILPLVDLSRRRPLRAVSRPKAAPSQGIRLVFVGRITRHKNQAMLVRALHWLRHVEKVPAELVLVGSQEPVYTRYVWLLAKALGLESAVRLTGSVGDDELGLTLHSSDAFVCVSEHEGFCIPLAEAMAADLPVFAWPGTAVAETLGDSGVKITHLEPAAIARQIRRTLDSPERMERVLAGQRRQLERLRESQNRDRIVELIRQAVDRLRQGPRRDRRDKKESAHSPLPAH